MRPTGLTASEDHKKKIKLGEEREKILEMGQESETKAAKAIIELSDEQEKKEEEEIAKITENLTNKRKFDKKPYTQALMNYMHSLLREEGIPKTYHYMIQELPKGLGLVVWKEPDKLLGKRKLKIIGEPLYDRHASMLFAYWAGDLIYKDYRELEDKGIILPK